MPCMVESNHVAMDEAQDAPDVVLGMFSAISHPATMLFDFGAPHSFISSQFVNTYKLPRGLMKNRVLVSSPGGEMESRHVCPKISICIRG